jgi:hypothetical protein
MFIDKQILDAPTIIDIFDLAVRAQDNNYSAKIFNKNLYRIDSVHLFSDNKLFY